MLHYGSHRLQQIKTFSVPSNSTLVFLHGGAWVYPNNDFNDYDGMIEHIGGSQPASNYKYSETYSINYRLSPEIRHPLHFLDVLVSLVYLGETKNTSNVTLIGHSVGATLAFQLLSYRSILQHGGFGLADLETYEWLDSFDTIDSFYTYVDSKMPRFDNFVLLAGIYDIPQLLDEFPSYDSFIAQTFSDPSDYPIAIQPATDMALETIPPSLHILQSYQDELISPKQQNILIEYLQRHDIAYTSCFSNFGAHDDIYQNNSIGDYIVKMLK